MTTPTLPEASDLYNVFGTTNINKWADADNVGVDDPEDLPEGVTNRIEWAIEQAANYILSKLARKYDTASWAVFPTLIFDIVVRRAGVELYRTPRGLVDGTDMMSAMIAMHDDVENRLNLVLAGALILIDLVEDQPHNEPGINNHADAVKFDLDNVWRV